MASSRAEKPVRGEDIALGFRDITLATATSPPTRVLADVSGYVLKGGITAVLGASSSGKSILLKALAGRGNELASLIHSGHAVLDGTPMALLRHGYPVAYARQDDTALVGILTVRETLTVAARLRCGPEVNIKERVDETLKRLGLEHVQHSYIGTLLVRGLSGGQKRRVSVGVELVASPKVLFLDEPTSGLDTATAVSVIQSVRDLARDAKTGVMLSIHQPNNDLLVLFDNILLLSGGQPVFFGTLRQAERYFTSLGFSPSAGETPTNYYLQLVDGGSTSESSRCGGATDMANTNFVAEYMNSALNSNVRHAICSASASCIMPVREDVMKSTFFTQVGALLWRNFTVARRDLSLLYLQFVLHSMYGFLIGAVFYKLSPSLDDRVNEVFGAIVWFMGLNAYIQVFKIHYLNSSSNIYHQEKPNNAYGVFAYFFAELLTTLVSITIFLAGTAIAFFMVGFDASNFGFSGVLVAYTTVFAAEGTAHFITEVARPNAALAVIITQAILVVGFVFAGGVFIKEDNIPHYWKWLSELSLFKHGSYAMMGDLLPNIDFLCPANFNDGTTCTPSTGGSFACVMSGSDCMVNGSDVMDQYFGMDRNKWLSLLYLFILGLTCRILVLVLYRYPMTRIMRTITSRFSPRLKKTLMDLDDRNRRLEAKVTLLEKKVMKNDPVYKAALTIQRAWRAHQLRKSMAQIAHTRSIGGGWVQSYENALVFRNVTVSLPKTGQILVDNVSGIAHAGRICALMGPSGAGKTTLLNGLSGRAPYAKVTGYVTVGKKLLSKDDLAYVPQFDSINPVFTPRELVRLTSHLLSRDPVEVQRKRVDDLLRIMGLGEVIDTPCGQLTGGLLKRVSIALGLVGQPPVLFLDEPTTGLDSTAAFQIVAYIAKVAEARNTAVIMTIHQPSMSVFARMQDLLLLSPGGKLAYFGSVNRATAYFSSCGLSVPGTVNPADFVLVAVSQPPPSKELGSTWAEAYNKSHMKIEAPVVVVDPSVQPQNKKPSEVSRFFTLTWHLLDYYNRQWAMFYYRLASMILIGFFIGTLYYNLNLSISYLTEISGAIFFSVWVVLFLVVGNTGVLVFDRLVVQDSYAGNRYGLLSWSLAQFVAGVPYTLACSLAFVLLFHFLIQVTMTFESFIFTVLLFWSLQEMMGSIVWCVAEVLKDAMLATTFAMIVLGSLFLFAGFFLSQDNMPQSIGWVPWIIPSRYALRGLLLNYFSSDITLDMPGGGTMTGPTAADAFFGITSSENKWGYFGVVLAFTAGIRALHICLMWLHFHKLGRSLSTGPAPANIAPARDLVVVDMNDVSSTSIGREENFVSVGKDVVVTAI